MSVAVAGDAISIDFSGRNVFVTGGSRGIAAEIVRAFARNGARVVFNYSAIADQRAGFPDAAENLVRELGGDGEVNAVEADLLSRDGPADLAHRVVEKLRTIDILVLSASLQINKEFLAITAEDIDAQLQLNIRANIQILQRIIPEMRRAGGGRIITIGSVQEVAPSPEMAVYAMTKAALENLVRNLAVENAVHGITVNNVAPGLVQTDRNAFRRQDSESWREFAANANPLGRAGQAGDIAGSVLFLASQAAAFITGATISVAGGAQVPGARLRVQRERKIQEPRRDDN
jgi:NAD(P)-dependent dehydrogenase (short-subunit alcohol dehydrogenase family)